MHRCCPAPVRKLDRMGPPVWHQLRRLLLWATHREGGHGTRFNLYRLGSLHRWTLRMLHHRRTELLLYQRRSTPQRLGRLLLRLSSLDHCHGTWLGRRTVLLHRRPELHKKQLVLHGVWGEL